MAFKRPTTTDVPDEFFDYWMPRLSLCEMRVLLYVVRRTFGFKKEVDAISFDQFMNGIKTRDGRVLDEGCGIKNKTSLSNALKSLIEKDLLRRKHRLTVLKDEDVSLYALAVEGEEIDLEALYEDGQKGGTKNVPPWSSECTTRGTNSVPRVVRESYPQQDSRTTHSKTKETSCAAKPRRPARADDYKRISTRDDEAANEMRRLALGWARRAMGADTSTEERIALYATCFEHLQAADVPVAKCKAFTLWCESEGWLKGQSRMFSEAIFKRYYGNWIDAGEPLVFTRREQKRDTTPAHIQREHEYGRTGDGDYSHEEQTPCCQMPVSLGHAFDCPHRTATQGRGA